MTSLEAPENTEDTVLLYSRAVFNIPSPSPWQRLIIAGVLDALIPFSEEIPALRQIAVLPTGAGKSLCWMLPAVLSKAFTVAVFPLLSLMNDQFRRLKECGIPAVLLRGGQSPQERSRIWQKLHSGDVSIVLTNPEILQNPAVEKHLASLSPRFLVVDETHTVSQWGESFRPACAGLGPIAAEWNPRAVLALTATAGPFLRKRITELLFNGIPPREALALPDRPSILYGVLPALSRSHVLEELIRREERPALVFGSTRSSVEQAARMLRFRLQDNRIRFYHAGLKKEEKTRLEQWFLHSRGGVLCATCAYGMGIDKKDIRTVVHLSPPPSVESYLQESGRASRDGRGARAWLIYTPADLCGAGSDCGAGSVCGPSPDCGADLAGGGRSGAETSLSADETAAAGLPRRDMPSCGASPAGGGRSGAETSLPANETAAAGLPRRGMMSYGAGSACGPSPAGPGSAEAMARHRRDIPSYGAGPDWGPSPDCGAGLAGGASPAGSNRSGAETSLPAHKTAAAGLPRRDITSYGAGPDCGSRSGAETSLPANETAAAELPRRDITFYGAGSVCGASPACGSCSGAIPAGPDSAEAMARSRRNMPSCGAGSAGGASPAGSNRSGAETSLPAHKTAAAELPRRDMPSYSAGPACGSRSGPSPAGPDSAEAVARSRRGMPSHGASSAGSSRYGAETSLPEDETTAAGLPRRDMPSYGAGPDWGPSPDCGAGLAGGASPAGSNRSGAETSLPANETAAAGLQRRGITSCGAGSVCGTRPAGPDSAEAVARSRRGMMSYGGSSDCGARPAGGSRSGAEMSLPADETAAAELPRQDMPFYGAGSVCGASPACGSCSGAIPAGPDSAEAMARSRRAAILRYAASVKRCRREILMEALGSQAEDCPGCDICGGSALSEAPEQALILRTVRQNRGRFQKGDLARVLIGRKTSAIRRAGLHYTRGFGTLAGWELEDAEEAVETLIRAGWLCRRSWGIGPFGLKKNRIWPAPQKKAERTVFQAG